MQPIYTILVHGFVVSDGGKASVGTLAPYFEKQHCQTYVLDYGFFGFFSTRWLNDNVARRLDDLISTARLSGYKVVVVGHSNGCAIINQAQQYIDKAVWINPALDSNADIARNIDAVDVWYSPSDTPVKWARLRPFSTWGAMGATGYTGKDARAKSYNKEEDYLPMSSRAHSDVFELPQRDFFGPLIQHTATKDFT